MYSNNYNKINSSIDYASLIADHVTCGQSECR